MNKLLLVVFVLVAMAMSAHGQEATKFYGKLIGLKPDAFHMYQRVLSVKAPADAKYRFVPALARRTIVSSGKMTDPRSSTEMDALLVEPPGAMPFLAIDFNADSKVSANERFVFVSAAPEEYVYAVVRVPITHAFSTEFPVFVRYFRGLKHPKLAPTDRLVDQTVWAHAMGDVSIGGKIVRFQYPFDPAEPTISTTEGLFGLDVDGDGLIHSEQFSLETSYATGTEVVLRYGDMYVSTVSIDPVKKEIVVRRREKAEYLREEIAVGKQMPDFSFIDFAGKKRSLAEFRGKYLLIEWWGVWCVDCVRDMPITVQAYERFRARGFEILGLNWDDKVEDAIGFLQKSNALWPQARKDSIKLMTEVTYRIQEYPSSILLGPEGNVISLDQKALQGPPLLETLDRILPRTPVK